MSINDFAHATAGATTVDEIKDLEAFMVSVCAGVVAAACVAAASLFLCVTPAADTGLQLGSRHRAQLEILSGARDWAGF